MILLQHLAADQLDGRLIVVDDPQLRPRAGDLDAERSRPAAEVAEAVVGREVEVVHDRLRRAVGEAVHGPQELLQPLGIPVQAEEEAAGPSHVVLRPAGLQRFLQPPPVRIEPVVQHLQHPADIARREPAQVHFCLD